MYGSCNNPSPGAWCSNNPSDEWLVICGTPFGVINKTCFGPPAVKKILRILSKLTFDHQV